MTFSDLEMIHSPKAVVAAVKAAEVKAISLAKPKKVKAVTKSTKGKVSHAFPIGIPLQMDEPNAFKNRQSMEILMICVARWWWW